MKAIELFAGIGGMHVACPWLQVVAAVDINQDSQAVYTTNFSTPYLVKELETLPGEWLSSQRADLWWMSPPCTPFTRKGAKRDLEDSRTRALLHLVDAVREIRPSIVTIENVVGFESSQTFAQIDAAWKDVGYCMQVLTLCPTQLGWPNRRPRVYVIASQTPIGLPPIQRRYAPTLKQIVESCVRNSHSVLEQNLMLESTIVSKYHAAVDIVDLTDPSSVAACFGSSYGRAITKAGSYVKTAFGLRRFTPREVANILGFPLTFALPAHLSMRRQWQLLGNSLSIPAVSHLMSFTR
jgi:site-specific DNA-cytosine methylase